LSSSMRPPWVCLGFFDCRICGLLLLLAFWHLHFSLQQWVGVHGCALRAGRGYSAAFKPLLVVNELVETVGS
jgi:hypothetical protein